MDNITHSLAGLLLADAAGFLRDRHQPAESSASRARFATTAAVTGVIGANLPDIDVPWHMLLQAMGRYDGLSSLLHHRGYTHTLLAALGWIPLLWVGAMLFRRRQLRRIGTSGNGHGDATALLLLSMAAVLSHTLLDFTNDYGVHPLSPFVNRWFYGDTIFIIEPWLWIVAGTAVLRNATRRAAQVALTTVLALAIGLSWMVPQVSRPAAMILTLGAAASLLITRRTSGRAGTAFGIGGWLAVTACFLVGTSLIRSTVRHAAPFTAPADRAAAAGVLPFEVKDVIVSPIAANPLCARIITVDANASQYRLTTAFASAVPALVTARWCARAIHSDTTQGAQHLEMEPVPVPDTDAIAWGWTWTAPRADLLALARTNCQVAAWMRFVRAPFWVAAGRDSIVVGDLRYDRDRRVGVAGYTFPATTSTCPPSVPPWSPARLDVWPELGP